MATTKLANRNLRQVAGELPRCRSVLAVCAHPDDESFGLGAVLARFEDLGSSVSVICLTHGEASTLGESAEGGLAALRQAELADAAKALSLHTVRLLGYPDGALGDEPRDRLTADVTKMAGETGADLLLVFDEGGITGHPDHKAATAAGLLAASRLGAPVLAWTLEQRVADALNSAFASTAFKGRVTEDLDVRVEVDRQRQMRAIACHKSQSFDNPVLRRRLAEQGAIEVLRWLQRR